MSKNKIRRGYSLRSFFTFMRQHKWRFMPVMFVFAVSNVMIAVIPYYIGQLVGALSADPVQGHQAVIYVWVLIGLSTGHNLLWRLAEVLYAKYISPLSFEYESILFRLIIRKPYSYFVDKFTGKISSYITTLSQEQRGFFDELCYNYVNLVVSLTAMLLILANVNWQTAAIFGAGVIAMFIVGRYTVRGSSRYERAFADVQSTKNAKIIDAVANFVNVKSFRKEASEIRAIDAEETLAKKAMKRSQIWAIVFWGSMSFIVRDLIWPATIGLNVYLFLHGSLTLAQLSVVLSTILIFTSVVWDAIWYTSQLNLRFARMEEAHRYLFGDVNVVKLHRTAVEPPRPSASFNQSLELRNLNFAYPDKPDTLVLRNLSLTVRRGQKLGIVGKSGSGKSTLTKLLLGYYDVREGSILLDGQPVDTHETANTIAYVPQDTSLFHRSIADNIAYAASGKVSRDDIVKAAKLAHAHEFISKVSDGYDALVGERGVKLSVGQRQRIAIARALLDNKQLLILDEATSALDSESEVLVQEALENLWDSKTVIAIAHRLSTLRHMDLIVVMDSGRIIEEGTHTELLAKKGTYAKLWTHQSGGFLEE